MTIHYRSQARKRSVSAGSRGMTLIEIMITLAIISLILGGVGLVAFNQFKAAQLDTARKDAIEIQGAVELYMAQKKGKCPKSLQQLKASGITARVPKDPWGEDYQIGCPGENTSVDVISGGPDKEIGTEDDISNYMDEIVDEEEE